MEARGGGAVAWSDQRREQESDIMSRIKRFAIRVNAVEAQWDWDTADTKLTVAFDTWRQEHHDVKILALTIGPRRGSKWIENPPVVSLEVLYETADVS